MAALKKGYDADVVKMGMKDEELFDLSLIDAEFLKLPKHLRDDVAQAPIDDHDLIAAIQQMDC